MKFAGADVDLAGVAVARLDGSGPQSKLEEADGGGVALDLSCAAPACVRECKVRDPRETGVLEDEGGEAATGAAKEKDGAAFRSRDGKRGGGAAELETEAVDSGVPPLWRVSFADLGAAVEDSAEGESSSKALDKVFVTGDSSTGARGCE